MSRTEANKEAILERVFCIQYPVRFKKDQDNMQALINSGNKIKEMNPTYAKNLGLCTDVGVQKIDGSHLETFSMVIASFLL